MLTWSSDPSTGIDVQWRTDTTVSIGSVKYRQSGTTQEFLVDANRKLMEDRVLMNDRFINRFTAKIRSLKPGTNMNTWWLPKATGQGNSIFNGCH